jgi:hypothetical protein
MAIKRSLAYLALDSAVELHIMHLARDYSFGLLGIQNCFSSLKIDRDCNFFGIEDVLSLQLKSILVMVVYHSIMLVLTVSALLI